MRVSAPSALKLDGSPHTFRSPTATRPTAWAGASCWCREGGGRGALDRRIASRDRTRALTHYPTDLLHSPPDVRSETTVAALGSGGLSVQAIPAHDEYAPAEASNSAKSDGGFVSLIENGG